MPAQRRYGPAARADKRGQIPPEVGMLGIGFMNIIVALAVSAAAVGSRDAPRGDSNCPQLDEIMLRGFEVALKAVCKAIRPT